MTPPRRARRTRGSTLLAVLLLLSACAVIAASVLMPAMCRRRESEMQVRRQRAFLLAEAGVDAALAEIRAAGGAAPASDVAPTALEGLGTYAVTFTAGDANGVDDDCDGSVDESDEDQFVVLTSVGTVGGARRAIEVVTRRTVTTPTITAAITLNVPAPIIDVNGNRFQVDGRDHGLDGAFDAFSPALHALATPAPVADIAVQLSPLVTDQFLGVDGTPSLTQTPLVDLAGLMAGAASAATIRLEPGSHANRDFGSATSSGIEVVVCEGDLHLSGNSHGAGILIVYGDLVITGNFRWTGLVLVDGTVRMSGGGSSKMVVGAVLVGAEMQSIDTDLTLAGTVDLLYSSSAVALASTSLASTSILCWREVAAP